MTDQPDAAVKVAALLYDDTEAVYRLVSNAVAQLRGRGLRVAGLLQRLGERLANGKRSFWLDDIETGRAVRLDEARGRGAQACTLDTDALAQGAWLLRRATEAKPDLIVVSRFGSVEAEGGGLRAEIAEAICFGAAVLIPVREAVLPDLERFLGGRARLLPASATAIADWAEQVTPALALVANSPRRGHHLPA